MDMRSNFGQYGTITTASVGSIVEMTVNLKWVPHNLSPFVDRLIWDLATLFQGCLITRIPKGNGMQTQSGLKSGYGELYYLSQIGSNSLLRSKVEASVKQEFDDDQYWDVNQLQSLRLNGLHNLGFVTGWSNERYQDAVVAGPYFDLFWFARLSNKVSTRLYASYGTPLDYASLQKARDYSPQQSFYGDLYQSSN